MFSKSVINTQQNISVNILKYRGFLICLIGLFLIGWIGLLRSEPLVGISHLMQQFQLVPQDLGQLTSRFYISYIVGLFSAGLIVDVFGPKLILLLALAVAVTGNYLLGHAISVADLATGRAMMGAANAFVMVSAFKMGTLALSRRHFVLYIGLLLTISMLAAEFGELALSAISSSFGWQQMLSLMNIMGCLFFALILVIFNDKSYQGENRKIISLGGILEFVKNPKIFVLSLVSMLGLFFVSSFIGLWGISFLKQFHNFSSTQATALIRMSVYGYSVGAIITAILSSITQKRRLLLIPGFFIAALSFTYLLYSPLSYVTTSWLLFFIGFFLGTNLLCFALAYDYSSSSNSGLVFSFIPLVGVLGNFLASSITAKLLMSPSAHLQSGAFLYSPESWQVGLVIIPVSLIVGGLLALYLRKPSSFQSEPITNIWKDIQLYWQGKGKLGQAYWLIYILGGVFLNLFILFVMTILSTFDFTSHKLPTSFYILALPYQLFAAVCVWRCAKNTTWSITWKYIARVMIIINLIYLLKTIFHYS
jgi:sugar phosphate permease